MRSFCYSGEGRLPDTQQRWYGKRTCLALDVLLLHNKSRVPGRTTRTALPGKHKGRTGYRSGDGVSARRWVLTGLYSVADWAWLLACRGKCCWELWEHYFSYQLTFIGASWSLQKWASCCRDRISLLAVLLVVVQNWLEAYWRKHCLTTPSFYRRSSHLWHC